MHCGLRCNAPSRQHRSAGRSREPLAAIKRLGRCTGTGFEVQKSANCLSMVSDPYDPCSGMTTMNDHNLLKKAERRFQVFASPALSSRHSRALQDYLSRNNILSSLPLLFPATLCPLGAGLPLKSLQIGSLGYSRRPTKQQAKHRIETVVRFHGAELH